MPKNPQLILNDKLCNIAIHTLNYLMPYISNKGYYYILYIEPYFNKAILFRPPALHSQRKLLQVFHLLMILSLHPSSSSVSPNHCSCCSSSCSLPSKRFPESSSQSVTTRAAAPLSDLLLLLHSLPVPAHLRD